MKQLRKMLNVKYFFPFFFVISILPVYATEKIYKCEVDAIKHLDTGKFSLIIKENRPKAILLVSKHTVNIKIGKDIKYTLKYIGSKKLMKDMNVDIYEKNGVQLEIVDISTSWSTGARFFRKNRMYMIGMCKH